MLLILCVIFFSKKGAITMFIEGNNKIPLSNKLLFFCRILQFYRY
jgi:hypothetical protein